MKRGLNKGVASTMQWNDKRAEGVEEVCNLFAVFISIYENDNPLTKNEVDIWEKSGGIYISLNGIEIKFDELLKEILSLDPSKGFGPEGIPNLFLKECAVGLCELLLFIFNKSLMRGVFPDWKNAYVVLIFELSYNRIIGETFVILLK